MTLNAVPTDPVIVTTDRRLTSVYQAFFSSIHDWLSPVGQNGTSADRPTSSSRNQIYVGQQYFDTTLGKPIFVKQLNPLIWVDASGAVV